MKTIWHPPISETTRQSRRQRHHTDLLESDSAIHCLRRAKLAANRRRVDCQGRRAYKAKLLHNETQTGWRAAFDPGGCQGNEEQQEAGRKARRSGQASTVSGLAKCAWARAGCFTMIWPTGVGGRQDRAQEFPLPRWRLRKPPARGKRARRIVNNMPAAEQPRGQVANAAQMLRP